MILTSVNYSVTEMRAFMTFSMRERLSMLSRVIPDKIYLKIRFRQRMGKKLNLRTPKTFNEKAQWIKLYDRNPLYCQLVDKYAVREFVASRIGEAYLINLVGGPWDSFDDIDFENLPEAFVLKCTHDSGGLIICQDKSKLNYGEAKIKINRSLKTNYYWHGREWPYKNVTPRIIAEEYMKDSKTDELRDYKFYCFYGEPKLMMVVTGRGKQATKADYYDMSFQHQNIKWGYPMAAQRPEKPQSFETMKRLAAELSSGIPEVRVDFYEVDGKVYFGELTFFDGSGMQRIEPEEWDYKMGEWIHLPE